ncbi:hypothetical protein ACFV1W_25425 [Kitasatospora sp. NPDC059648]|uniref:hypothetical protein n=1 Tax=Kitasatospora sp. NPDC059648 TaxID=3346894 RepID=UPI0036928F8B
MLQLLHPLPPASRPAPPPRPRTVVDGPYECAADKRPNSRPTPTLLIRTRAQTDWLAAWWLQLQAQQLADELPPVLAAPVLAWLADEGEQEHVRRLLAVHEPYTLTVTGVGAEHRLSVRLWQPRGEVTVEVRR